MAAIYKRGSVYWVRFTAPDGTQVRQSARTKNRDQAQQLLNKLTYEAWSQKTMKARPRHTWDEAALLWLEEKSEKKSIQGDICMIRWLTPFFRGKYLEELTRPVIMRIAEKKKAESSPSRANRYLALIRAILNRAVRIWEWLDKAPALTLYREPKVRVRYLTTPEIHRLMSELPEHLKPVFQCSIMTGLRRSNILNLRWDQVDFVRRQIVIDGSEMKAGQTHVVPMSPSLIQLLMQQIDRHPVYVFTRYGRKITWFERAWRGALARAGITNYRWHDNRHTWASILRQAGISLDVLQELGGWHSEQMVKRYAHLAPHQVAETAAIVDRVFCGNSTVLAQSKIQ
jgi:integrase